jgi:RHS repeat-associated protein
MQTGIAQAYYPPYQMGSAEIHIPMADHMGNIRHYFQIKSVAGSVTGQISGNLEYDAFGREVRAWGTTTGATPPPGLPVNRPFIDQLPFHFSSKFTDQESGFNYYGYRFYNADWSRWLNRDPIGEEGGLNIYTLVRNRAANLIDILGLNEAGTTNPGQDGDTCRITILVGHSSTARGLINGVKLPSTENLEGSDRVACVTCNRKSTNANLPADKQIPGDPNSRIDNYIFPGQESDMKKHEDYDKERGDETVKKAYEKELENVKSYAKNKLCACCPLGVEIRVRGIDDDGIEWVTHNVNGLVKDSGKLGVRLRLNPCDTASLK